MYRPTPVGTRTRRQAPVLCWNGLYRQRVFDQTANENHLFVFGADDDYQGRQDKAANASIDPHTISGHRVYSLFTEPGMGYRTVAEQRKALQ